MVAYSFKFRFIDPILEGRKDQTIRARRVRHAFEGERLQLYTGMRTKQCRLILKTVCLTVLPVQLRWRPVIEFTLNGDRLAAAAMDAFAKHDGFDDVSDMERFWAETHPRIEVFAGVVVSWRPPRSPVPIGTILEGSEQP